MKQLLTAVFAVPAILVITNHDHQLRKKPMKIRTIARGSVAIATALVLAACTTPFGTMEGMDHSAANMFNNADETFLMEMIAHHEQAIEMADMVLDEDGVDEQVTELAQKIKAAQGPEIETMKSWLDDWGMEFVDSGMEGMDHSGGMMSDDDMALLENATGADASRVFLELMIEHHQGAIVMAQRQLDNGVSLDALELAQAIIDDQTAEIAVMQALLAEL